MGHVPKMIYRHRILRAAEPAECDTLDQPEGAEVLDIQRRILADDIAVCYFYDVLPRWAFQTTSAPTNSPAPCSPS